MKSDAIIGAVQGVTKKWSKQRKREEREASARQNRAYVMMRRRSVTIKEAAWQIMGEAYLKASAGGSLPAHARQIMYAARSYIQRTADKPLSKTFDQYFIQHLLPEHIEEYGCDWNVVFDARGHLHEPHSEEEVPLGTLQVRNYLSKVYRHKVRGLDFNIWEKRYPTLGPKNRYGAILFIEKEGFMPLFEEVKLAERYDIAIMSTKGMSVTASRELVDNLCGDYGIPLLVLHDFDKAGFSIVGTLKRTTRRYGFKNEIRVIDLGLRLGDIDGLETENVFIDNGSAARRNLLLNGATEEEARFLLDRRVELNAFASDELIAWIEGKLAEHGIEKVIPQRSHLEDAFRRALQQTRVQHRIDELLEDLEDEEDQLDICPGLDKQVKQRLAETPEIAWDEAVRTIAMEHAEREEDAT